ncbi:MAG: hypothetical protein QOI21_571 [Actinomycetota bacterium]|jgi:hypothetical protein|nr:hypothetical protein [Actinomycetota bacterium]
MSTYDAIGHLRFPIFPEHFGRPQEPDYDVYTFGSKVPM